MLNGAKPFDLNNVEDPEKTGLRPRFYSLDLILLESGHFAAFFRNGGFDYIISLNRLNIEAGASPKIKCAVSPCCHRV